MVGFDELESDAAHNFHGISIPKKDHDHADKVILWDKRHHNSGENFLIASRTNTTHLYHNDAAKNAGDLQTAANLIAAAIPVFYSVDEFNILDYAYNYKNQDDIVKKIAYREIITYLASTDFIHLMGHGRMDAKANIETRIKAALAAMTPSIGIKIHHVGIMEIHPPVAIARAYQDVTAAHEIMHANILKAEKDAVILQRDAEIKSHTLISAAGGLHQETQLASAEALRFSKQQQLFLASPTVYTLRSFLEMFETETEDVKKYVITTESREIFILNDLKIEPIEEN